MKNIINTSKRSIILILTLCILLCTSGIGVQAISMPEENIAVTEEITVVVEETTVATEKTIVVTEETTPELIPTMARGCGYDNYYIEGEPDIPMGAMPVGDSVIGNYVSQSFLSFVVGLGYPDTGWYYYMQDYRLPNGQLVKYHIWANDSLDIVFHHRR